MFCFFYSKLLWHKILHANLEAKTLKHRLNLHLGGKKSEKKYKNVGYIVWYLIIGITLLVKREYIKKPCLNIYIYIYLYENFDNRLLVGVEFKYLKLRR